MNSKIYLLLVGLIVLFQLISCKDDDQGVCADYDISYNGEIKKIIDNSCAFALGCHSGQWQVLPDFSNYASLKPYCDNGLFAERVFSKDSSLLMPPIQNVPPENQLTAVQLEILSCWMEKDFPED